MAVNRIGQAVLQGLQGGLQAWQAMGARRLQDAKIEQIRQALELERRGFDLSEDLLARIGITDGDPVETTAVALAPTAQIVAGGVQGQQPAPLVRADRPTLSRRKLSRRTPLPTLPRVPTRPTPRHPSHGESILSQDPRSAPQQPPPTAVMGRLQTAGAPPSVAGISQSRLTGPLTGISQGQPPALTPTPVGPQRHETLPSKQRLWEQHLAVPTGSGPPVERPGDVFQTQAVFPWEFKGNELNLDPTTEMSEQQIAAARMAVAEGMKGSIIPKGTASQIYGENIENPENVRRAKARESYQEGWASYNAAPGAENTTKVSIPLHPETGLATEILVPNRLMLARTQKGLEELYHAAVWGGGMAHEDAEQWVQGVLEESNAVYKEISPAPNPQTSRYPAEQGASISGFGAEGSLGDISDTGLRPETIYVLSIDPETGEESYTQVPAGSGGKSYLDEAQEDLNYLTAKMARISEDNRGNPALGATEIPGTGVLMTRQPLTAKQRETLDSLGSITDLMDEIEDMSRLTNRQNRAFIAPLVGIWQKGQALVGGNNEAVRLQAMRKAFAGLFARLGGETGRFTEGDIARAMKMIPDLLMTHDNTVWLLNFANGILHEKLKGITMPYSQGLLNQDWGGSNLSAPPPTLPQSGSPGFTDPPTPESTPTSIGSVRR